MKKIVFIATLLITCLLTACGQGEKETPSNDIYDGELEINGHIVPRDPDYEWLTSIGLTEKKDERQGCDACDTDGLIFYNDNLGYKVRAYIWEASEHQGEEKPKFQGIQVILTDSDKELATFSGGITLGKTTQEELEEMLPNAIIHEENGMITFDFIDGPGIFPIRFACKEGALHAITVFALINPYENGERVDITAYESLKDYDGESMLVDTNVLELSSHLMGKETFVFVAGFSDCPWCNRIMPYLNEIAKERNYPIGYLDTRKDPAWESNLDIDDYKLFVERFGEYLEEDDDGIPHLYVPDIYFIKKGKVVMRFDVSIEGADDVNIPLTEEQIEYVKKTLNEGFDLLR